MIVGLVGRIHIPFGLKSRAPVASKGLALHAVHATLVGLSRPKSPRVRKRQAT